jgi:flagellum-specific peptidoglycan hydrolase FlgJ
VTSRWCNAVDAVAFVYKYKNDCQKVIDEYSLDVPVENILGLAAKESGYGKGRIASELNNYFSMHAPAPFQTGSEAPHGNPNAKVAKFSSFHQSAQSFSKRFRETIRGKKDPLHFAKALVCNRACYNTGDKATGGNPNFIGDLVGVINAVKERLSCQQK